MNQNRSPKTSSQPPASSRLHLCTVYTRIIPGMQNTPWNLVKFDNHSLPCLTKNHQSRTEEKAKYWHPTNNGSPAKELIAGARGRKENKFRNYTSCPITRKTFTVRWGKHVKFINNKPHIQIAGISSSSRWIFELLWPGTSANSALNVKFRHFWFQQLPSSWASCMPQLLYAGLP